MRIAHASKVADFATYIVAHPPVGWETSGDPGTWSEQWATEIMPLANDALMKITIGDAKHAPPGRNPKCTWPVKVAQNYAGWANNKALTGQPGAVHTHGPSGLEAGH
jgi:hypothetical protein